MKKMVMIGNCFDDVVAHNLCRTLNRSKVTLTLRIPIDNTFTPQLQNVGTIACQSIYNSLIKKNIL